MPTIPELSVEYAPPSPTITLEPDKGDIPAEAHQYFSQGVELSRRGKHREALEAFEEALKLIPGDPDTWCNKGVVLHYLGRHQEAIESYNQALEHAPALPETWFNLGLALLHLQKFKAALDSFERAIYLSPECQKAWSVKGVALLMLGKDEEGRTALERALQYDEDDAVAWYNLGGALWKLVRPAEAHQAFEKAWRLRGALPHRGEGLYKMWSTFTLLRGVACLVDHDIGGFEEAGLIYIDILEKAQHDNMEQVVKDAPGRVKAELQNEEERGAFEELELAIRLLSINDPSEGWRAFTKEISKVWPAGVSAVDAIREQRD